METGIFLVVQFNWPRPFQPEYGELARALHQVVQGQDWIQEVLAASGGVGAGPASLWIFKLGDYAALDRLFQDREDPVAQAYGAFFRQMEAVEDYVREEVRFS